MALSTDMIAAPASAARSAGHAHAPRGKSDRDSDFAEFLASTANPATAPQDDGAQNSNTSARASSAAGTQDDAAAPAQDGKAAGKPDKIVAGKKDDNKTDNNKTDGKEKDGADASSTAQISAAAGAIPPAAPAAPLAAPHTDMAVLARPDKGIDVAGDGKATVSTDPGQAIPGDGKPAGKTSAGDGKARPDHPQAMSATAPTGVEAPGMQETASVPAAAAQSIIASALQAPAQPTATGSVPPQPVAPASATAISNAVAKPVAGKSPDIAADASEDAPAAPLAAQAAPGAPPKSDSKDSTPTKKAPATFAAVAPTSDAPSPVLASDGKDGIKDAPAASRTAAPAADDARPSHNAAPDAAAPQPQAAAPVPAPAPAPFPNPSLIAGGIPVPTIGANAAAPAISLHIANAHPEAAPDLDALAVSVAARAIGGAKQFEIRLDPPELGRVDVRLSIDASGKTQAHMTADQPQTLDLLQKDAPTLTQALRDAGLDVSQGGLNFSLRGQDRQAHDGGQGTPGRRTNLSVSRVIGAVQAQAAMSAGGAAADARLDIHV